MTNFEEDNIEEVDNTGYTYDMEEFGRIFYNPSSGDSIPDQKGILDGEVMRFNKTTIIYFERKVKQHFNTTLINNVVNRQESIDIKTIRKEFLYKELRILNRIFLGIPTQEDLIIRIPQQILVNTNGDYFMGERPVDLRFDDESIRLLRDHYRIHVMDCIAIDYTRIPIIGTQLARITSEFKNLVFCEVLVKYYEWIKQQNSLSHIKKQKSQPPSILLDIWLPDNAGSKDEYYRTIENLKSFNPTIDGSFLEETNGKLFWNRRIIGSLQFLSGWLHVCISKGWIHKSLSAPKYQKILNETFNAKIGSSTHFKRIDVSPPKDKYYAPFNNIPHNLPPKH